MGPDTHVKSCAWLQVPITPVFVGGKKWILGDWWSAKTENFLVSRESLSKENEMETNKERSLTSFSLHTHSFTAPHTHIHTHPHITHAHSHSCNTHTHTHVLVPYTHHTHTYSHLCIPHITSHTRTHKHITHMIPPPHTIKGNEWIRQLVIGKYKMKGR